MKNMRHVHTIYLYGLDFVAHCEWNVKLPSIQPPVPSPLLCRHVKKKKKLHAGVILAASLVACH